MKLVFRNHFYRVMRTVVVLCVAVACVPIATADTVTLKLASIAPQNSVWGRRLEAVSAEIATATNSEIQIQIFHAGILGTGADGIRKMQLGQIDAVILDSSDLLQIDDASLTFSLPGLINTPAEFDYILDTIGNELKEEISDASPYYVVGWGGLAWVYPFLSEPFRTPQDMGKYRIAGGGTENSNSLVQFYRELGLNPVQLPVNEWLTALSSGLIDGLLTSSALAAGFQWFGIADNMIDVQLAPVLIAIVTHDRVWDRITPERQRIIESIVSRNMKALTKESIEFERKAIGVMKKFDLNVIELSDAERMSWRDFFRTRILDENNQNRSAAKVRGLFDLVLYNRIETALAEYRSASGEYE